MENKYAIIIIIITIIIAIGIGSALGFLTNQSKYKEYKDAYIQVDIPADTNLKVINNSDPRVYNSTNTILTIRILSFNASNPNSEFGYALTRGVVESNYSHYKMNGVNYNETVYNDSGKYYIFIFDDVNRNIICLMSSNLDTVMHMADTFQLLKKPTFISFNSKISPVTSPKINETNISEAPEVNSTTDEPQTSSNYTKTGPTYTDTEGDSGSSDDYGGSYY